MNLQPKHFSTNRDVQPGSPGLAMLQHSIDGNTLHFQAFSSQITRSKAVFCKLGSNPLKAYGVSYSTGKVGFFLIFKTNRTDCNIFKAIRIHQE